MVSGKLEDISIDEKVDMIISEWMGCVRDPHAAHRNHVAATQRCTPPWRHSTGTRPSRLPRCGAVLTKGPSAAACLCLCACAGRTMLLFELMLESVLAVRDKWLKPGGVMWPSAAELFVVPVSADELFKDKINFWDSSPYGVDLSHLAPKVR